MSRRQVGVAVVNTHLVLIILQGSGKTLPGLLSSACLDDGKSTIWVLPLRSLHEQYQLRCIQHGLTCGLWSPTMSATCPPSTILVSVESTQWGVFKEFVKKLLFNDYLARVIVDEAHLALTHAMFREIMKTLQWIGSLDVQIVLLTATLPISLEGDLLDTFGLTTCYTSRAETSRPNIAFNVVRSPSSSLDQTVKDEYGKAFAYSSSNRILVFCLSKREARLTAQQLGIPHCDADHTQEEIDALLKRFREGDVRAISCTSLLGVGLDVPNLTHVIHRGYPRDAIAFTQEVGRLGRGSERCWSIVVLSCLPAPPVPCGRFGERLVQVSMECRDHCRRLLIQQFMDGQAKSCLLLGEMAHLCDVCHEQSCWKPVAVNALAFPSGLIGDATGSQSVYIYYLSNVY
jgi:superfamily II DNA helicase RecQ